jgi:hypothetical protein
VKFIGVHKVLAGVVRRVDVDHLHLAEVALLEDLERFEVVAFDEEVLRGVKIDTLLPSRGGGSW